MLLRRSSVAIWISPLLVLLGLLTATSSTGRAEEQDVAAVRNAFKANTYPLVQKYCGDCHGGDGAPEGDIDLSALAEWKDASKATKTWQKVDEMLANGLMPPEDAEQPSDAERAQLRKWLHDYLAIEARSHAGDPGRVILRRLSNAEYTYTLRDLTGVDSLDPAREFPADGAAGEGFTNTGGALVMSPALATKYLDAGKEVASHAVLLPDGIRFSPHATTRDWTDDLLAQIRGFYAKFSDSSGGSKVNLQGVVFDTNQGGRLPVNKYLAATLDEREALAAGKKSIEAVAKERGLNAKYLQPLWTSLHDERPPSLLLDDLRTRWQTAKPGDAAALTAHVEAWQKALWTFSSVGLIGRKGGPKQWMEPVDPLTTQQEFKFKIPEKLDAEFVTISLVATDAGDGNEGDVVVWKSPRLVAAGQPDLLLRDVRKVAARVKSRRQQLFANAAAYLNAAETISLAKPPVEIAKIASEHGLAEADLRAWLDYLGIGTESPAEIKGLYITKLTQAGGHESINGWGSNDTPSLLANSSDAHLRIPGNVKPHSVVVHPSPALCSAVAWRSSFAGAVNIAGTVSHAHPECGNGVTWALEIRRGASRQRLAEGVAQGAGEAKVGPFDAVRVREGDMVALLIGPRNGDHSCDLTAIDLTITDQNDKQKAWNLGQDVSRDVLAANPHADRFGNSGVWHFFSEPDSAGAGGRLIPTGSLLAKWQTAADANERKSLADEVQKLLTTGPPSPPEHPDAVLYRQLASMRGPLAGNFSNAGSKDDVHAADENAVGLDASEFGPRNNEPGVDSADLLVRAPSVVEIRLPADLVAGCELTTAAVLCPEIGKEGSAQVAITEGRPKLEPGLLHGDNKVIAPTGHWLVNNPTIANSAPILVTEGSEMQRRVRTAFEEYRQLLPPALCYTKIVPVDEAVSVTLFFREDGPLVRLMLNDDERKKLDRLWDELHFVSGDALTSVDAYEQLMEFATQDADPKVFEHMRKPIHDRAAEFRQYLVACEPKQLQAAIDFAGQAYRRPLTSVESQGLRSLYESLRQEELPHADALRLVIARVLVSPAFLYRFEQPVSGATQGPVSDWELANRLSYFLWASQPDSELRRVAEDGQLHDPKVLVEQTQRMLSDPRARRLATEFATHWLQIDGFERLDEKSDRHFPKFAELRGAMAEESTLFFTDLFQHNRSVLNILDADYTFLNEPLAQFYGIPDVQGAEWRRVEGVKKYSRGGVLAQATTLAKQSGASRTSPILRGNWISEVLLGERLPKPPKGVPPLPDDEAATEGLTVRQLVEKHVTDPKCAVCHRRIDPYGFSLEAFDAIGGRRDKDLGDRPLDTRVKAMDGAEFESLAGLQNYLLTSRRDAFLHQFCRKLLGYALGRAVQLSDEPLLADMERQLAEGDYKVHVAIEAIVRSPQFREIRGVDSPLATQDLEIAEHNLNGN